MAKKPSDRTPFSFGDLFKGIASAPADAARIVREVEEEMAAKEAAEKAAATPDRIPPQQIYKDFDAHVAPVLETLKKLPADESGMEFFLRADVVNDINGQPKDQRIDVWLFYTRDITYDRKKQDMPDSHMIQMERKDSTPENRRYDILMELSLRPVLRLSVLPYDKTRQIEVSQYIEYYETPEHGHEYPIFIGGYGQVHDTQSRKQLPSMESFTNEIEDWIKTVAEDKAPRILNTIGFSDTKLRHDVMVGKPLQLKKKKPGNAP